MFPRGFGTTEYLQQSGAVLVGNRRAQSIQVMAEMVDYTKHRVAVGKKDVVPHDWITGRNAGEVAETAGRIAKYIQILVFPRQRIDQRKRDKVRQMTGRRQYLVVIGD